MPIRNAEYAGCAGMSPYSCKAHGGDDDGEVHAQTMHSQATSCSLLTDCRISTKGSCLGHGSTFWGGLGTDAARKHPQGLGDPVPTYINSLGDAAPCLWELSKHLIRTHSAPLTQA